MSIFLVEDDYDFRELCRNILTFFGYKIVGESSGFNDAYHILSQSKLKPDILIVDYHLKGETGIEVAKKFKTCVNSNIKTILLSGDPEVANKIKDKQQHITIFREKPLAPDELINLIKLVTEKKNYVKK
ncbi:MAG: response regulator [Promethearchaeota archaeon]